MINRPRDRDEDSQMRDLHCHVLLHPFLSDSICEKFLFVFCRISLTLSCPMKLHKFPLDTQQCSMQMESCEYKRLDKGREVACQWFETIKFFLKENCKELGYARGERKTKVFALHHKFDGRIRLTLPFRINGRLVLVTEKSSSPLAHLEENPSASKSQHE